MDFDMGSLIGGANFRLRRGQLVELVLDEPVDSVRCEVVWTGKAESEQVGEVGLQIVAASCQSPTRSARCLRGPYPRIPCPSGFNVDAGPISAS